MAAPRPRLWDASGIELIRDALTVPFHASMATEKVPLSDGVLAVARDRTREPILLVSLKRPLADEAVIVQGTVDGRAVPRVIFAPYSHSGSHLLIFRPELPPDGHTAGPFGVRCQVFVVSGDEAFTDSPSVGAPLSNAEAAKLVEGVVLEGILGRLLYLATMETMRILRQGREIQAMRYLDLARRRALDDLGADFGVPRFTDIDEDDDHYRARLRIYSSWRLPTPAGFRDGLNGPGDTNEPNRGLPAGVGVHSRFEVVEDINELAISFRVVGLGPEGNTLHRHFQQALQNIYLTDIDSPPSDALPSRRRLRWKEIQTTLRDELTRNVPPSQPTPRWLAPQTALALSRAVRLMRRLGHSAQIRLDKAYDPRGGSRYELGLGCSLRRLTSGQLDGLAGVVATVAAGSDEIAQTAAGLTPRPSDADPLGRWLFEGCGFRTVHPVPGNRIYLSPLPSYGLWIDGPSSIQLHQQGEYRCRYESGDGIAGRHLRAQEALEELGRSGAPIPAALSPADLNALLSTLESAGDVDPPSPFSPLVSMGLVTRSVGAYAQILTSSINLDEVVGFTFSSLDLADMAPAGNLEEAMAARVEALFDAGFYSVRGLWDAANDRLLLLAAVSQLPGASSRPGEPPPASFRWYTTEIPKAEPDMTEPTRLVQRYGGRIRVEAKRSGLILLAVIAYARRGLADPYEVQIKLPDAPERPLLNADQYEYLMNLLGFSHPIGIEINTFDIRRRHVDIDGDGEPEWLTSRASRTYHLYRQRRPFGFPGGRETRDERNTS